jgi:Histidine phosphatase superfamily (branch 1)
MVHETTLFTPMTHRRTVLRLGSLAALPLWHGASHAASDAPALGPAVKLLRQGGCVVALRHAVAPGTFDPPGFTLGDCSTQRNLSDEGREQARRLGAWFKQQGLSPAAVRSSPWCRCVDTATLAFGQATPWPALGSPRGASEGTNQQSLQALRQGLHRARGQRGRFEVWVTHMFVLADLAQVSVASGEGLVLQADAAGAPTVLARLQLP